MTREQLEHLIRVSADIASDDDIVVVGSQAILGQYPDAPAALRVSAEADVFPKNRPERADLIDGSIGELSPFHATYGYYAQGVSESTGSPPVAQGPMHPRLLRCSSSPGGTAMTRRRALQAGRLDPRARSGD